MKAPFILVLHSLEVRRSKYSISTRSFKTWLEQMLEAGWTGVTLLDALKGCNKPRLFAVSFDDGYESVYEEAFPVLKAFSIPATIFVPTAFVGGDNSWNHRASVRENHLTWRQLRELQENRWEVGHHTHRHYNLLALQDHEIEEEMKEANSVFAEELPIAPATFAYPYGKVDQRVAGVIGLFYEYACIAHKIPIPNIVPRLQLPRYFPGILPDDVPLINLET